MALSNSYIERIRLSVGDTDEDYKFLEDSVYEFLYFENQSNELKTAVAALESIINYISLNPESETLGQVSGKGVNSTWLEQRLTQLLNKANKQGSRYGKVPIVIRSDRKDWNDFGKIF